ncbi:MAG: DNA/RNA non-specific endonuclease [Clostridium sp.]
MKNAKRNDYAQKVAGRGDRLDDDQGGHLIASIFNGSGDLDNLVPMNGNLNQSAWKIMENAWSKALNKGDIIEVKIDVIYTGISQRPSSFRIEYTINGKFGGKETFDNILGGGKL